MKKTIGISFVDNDRFFAEGICYALKAYFHQHSIDVYFTKKMTADLIFQAVPKGDRANFCHPPNYPCGLYLSIRDIRDRFARHYPTCQREVGAIYRTESVDMLLQTVNRVMSVRDNFVKPVSCCTWCEPLKLTCQEKMIMRCFSWEMTPTAIARRLNVSIKTVSTHKRAVMKKMNFNRDAELYHWLRVGRI